MRLHGCKTVGLTRNCRRIALAARHKQRSRDFECISISNTKNLFLQGTGDLGHSALTGLTNNSNATETRTDYPAFDITAPPIHKPDQMRFVSSLDSIVPSVDNTTAKPTTATEPLMQDVNLKSAVGSTIQLKSKEISASIQRTEMPIIMRVNRTIDIPVLNTPPTTFIPTAQESLMHSSTGKPPVKSFATAQEIAPVQRDLASSNGNSADLNQTVVMKYVPINANAPTFKASGNKTKIEDPIANTPKPLSQTTEKSIVSKVMETMANVANIMGSLTMTVSPVKAAMGIPPISQLQTGISASKPSAVAHKSTENISSKTLLANETRAKDVGHVSSNITTVLVKSFPANNTNTVNETNTNSTTPAVPMKQVVTTTTESSVTEPFDPADVDGPAGNQASIHELMLALQLQNMTMTSLQTLRDRKAARDTPLSTETSSLSYAVNTGTGSSRGATSTTDYYIDYGVNNGPPSTRTLDYFYDGSANAYFNDALYNDTLKRSFTSTVSPIYFHTETNSALFERRGQSAIQSQRRILNANAPTIFGNLNMQNTHTNAIRKQKQVQTAKLAEPTSNANTKLLSLMKSVTTLQNAALQHSLNDVMLTTRSPVRSLAKSKVAPLNTGRAASQLANKRQAVMDRLNENLAELNDLVADMAASNQMAGK